jgi:signal transduction histidine kinase
MAPTRVVLWTTAALALGAGAVVAALIRSNPSAPSNSTFGFLTGEEDDRVLLVLVGLVVGWSFVGSGLIAWARRPESRVGLLLIAVGFSWFVSGLQYSDVSVLFTVGTLFQAVFVVVFAWVVLAFPEGRLGSPLYRVLLLIAFVDVTVVEAARMAFEDFDAGVAGAPENLLLVEDDDRLADLFVSIQRGVGVVLSLLTVGLLADRWRRASAPQRRAIAPVIWAGAGAFAVLAFSAVNDSVGQPLGDIEPLVWLVFAATPWAFLAGLLRVRLARSAVADLVVELSGTAAPGELRDALSRALGDPSLEVAYWIPDQRRYVDLEGRSVELPADGEGRIASFVERDGRRIAALVHDPALREDPALVASVSAAAALALENERLQAELRARLEELRASRARIVEAAETERRRIERNLHDGTQQRLVSIAMTLGLAESKLDADRESVGPIVAEAREALSAALEELRELSQGIHPGILRERGLTPALRQLVYRAGVPLELDVALEERLPEQVEATAYYVVSESLANVAKYAQATAARVQVARRDGSAVVEIADDGVGGADGSRGSGIRGLRDRVEALGGSFSLASPPGRGTIVRAEIPCA